MTMVTPRSGFDLEYYLGRTGEKTAAPGWPSGPVGDHGISRVTAYWYLDEVITVLAERAPDLGEAQIGDIARAALVLTHFEHSYITRNSLRSLQCHGEYDTVLGHSCTAITQVIQEP